MDQQGVKETCTNGPVQAAKERGHPSVVPPRLVPHHNLVPEHDDSDQEKNQIIYLPVCQGSPLWKHLNIQELPSLKTPGVAPASPAPEAVYLAAR